MLQKALLNKRIHRSVGSIRSLHFHIETYGCQMNINDSEIIRSILLKEGHQACTNAESADLILTNTCAIRENAENKIWNRIDYFQSLKRKQKLLNKNSNGYPIIGILGCMAERIKEKLLEKEAVDFICGPDGYRDIPTLLSQRISTSQKQSNLQLSLDETYANISPVRESNTSHSAFVSIMRGCNNMCSFCIVPFTRGRERSRPLSTILQEVQTLSSQGVKEVVLLGQNVNGYHDTSEESSEAYKENTLYQSSPGFNNLYQSKRRNSPGARFDDLLAAVSDINPGIITITKLNKKGFYFYFFPFSMIEMRIRFTSPHPKDFPLSVLSLIRSRPNICSSIHLPLQSGSTSMLARMRRGYTREAYLNLVDSIRDLIPNVAISTDIIAGFCEETEEEHQDTLSLMDIVQYDQVT